MCNIVPIVVPLVLVLVLAMLVILIIFSLVWKRKHKKSSTEEVDNTAHNMEVKKIIATITVMILRAFLHSPIIGTPPSSPPLPMNIMLWQGFITQENVLNGCGLGEICDPSLSLVPTSKKKYGHWRYGLLCWKGRYSKDRGTPPLQRCHGMYAPL